MKKRSITLITFFFAAVLSISVLLFAADFETSLTSDSEEGAYTSWNSG